MLAAAPAKAPADRWRARIEAMPAQVQATAARGALRCLDFQNVAYAERFLAEAESLCAAAGNDAAAIAVAEDAVRSLALWRCFEDVIRVADLKSRRERYGQVRAETQARPGQVLRVTEVLAPGVDELAAILPRRIGAALMRTAARRGWSGRAHFALPLRSTSAWGCALLRGLAGLKPLRPRSLRQSEEDEAIAAWLDAMRRVLPHSTAYAAPLARLPDVLKGYGDTQRRGRASYAALWRQHVAPALSPRDYAATPADPATPAHPATATDIRSLPDPGTLAERAAPFAAALRAAVSQPPADHPAPPTAAAPQPVRVVRNRPKAASPP